MNTAPANRLNPPGAMTMAPLWIDGPDARQRIADAPVDDYVKSAAIDLAVDGFAVVRGAHAVEDCRRVIAEYESWASSRADYVRQNLDANGHEKRLVDFHHTSRAAESIATNPKIMKILDFVFGREAGVYSSLTFKYGTQQPVHRDTPHFATWPRKQFVGAWTALEDVAEDAGPLFYYKAAHRFEIDPIALFEEACLRMPKAPRHEQLLSALDVYNGRVIDGSKQFGPAYVVPVRAGDTVIWHPETPHGGTPARRLEATRWSVVFHCAPVDTQVHQHDRFFSHRGPEAPPPRYRFREADGRKFAIAGTTAYM